MLTMQLWFHPFHAFWMIWCAFKIDSPHAGLLILNHHITTLDLLLKGHNHLIFGHCCIQYILLQSGLLWQSFRLYLCSTLVVVSCGWYYCLNNSACTKCASPPGQPVVIALFPNESQSHLNCTCHCESCDCKCICLCCCHQCFVIRCCFLKQTALRFTKNFTSTSRSQSLVGTLYILA